MIDNCEIDRWHGRGLGKSVREMRDSITLQQYEIYLEKTVALTEACSQTKVPGCSQRNQQPNPSLLTP